MLIVIVEHVKLGLVFHVLRDINWSRFPEDILIFKLDKDFLLWHSKNAVKVFLVDLKSLRCTTGIV